MSTAVKAEVDSGTDEMTFMPIELQPDASLKRWNSSSTLSPVSELLTTDVTRRFNTSEPVMLTIFSRLSEVVNERRESELIGSISTTPLLLGSSFLL